MKHKNLNQYKVEYKIINDHQGTNRHMSDTVYGHTIKDVLDTMNKVHYFVKIEVISINPIEKDEELSIEEQYESFINRITKQAFYFSPFKEFIPHDCIEDEIEEWLRARKLDFYQVTDDDTLDLIDHLQGTGENMG